MYLKETYSVAQWILPLGNDGALRSHFRVQLLEWQPLFREVVFMENSLNRAFRNACLAINAFIWVDVKDLITFIKALDWANHNTVGVLACKARLSNYVSHRNIISYSPRWTITPCRMAQASIVYRLSAGEPI